MSNVRRRMVLLAVTGMIAFPVVILVVLLNVDWNRAKPWINARTSEAIGRPFTIAGDLSLTWERQAIASTDPEPGWRSKIPWPHLIAQDIHIGNPASATAPSGAASTAEMASIKQLAFSLNPLALLEQTIAIPILRFDTPEIHLQRSADGSNNWTFKNNDPSSRWNLKLQRVVFTKGRVHVKDALKHADVTVEVDTIDADPRYGVTWQLAGKFNGEKISGNGKAGAMLNLQNQTTPYPIMAHLRQGKTVIAVEGALTKPTDLAALDLRLTLSGASMAHLYALSGLVLPETPPFITEGHLIGALSPHNSHWIYEKFSGKVGSSDISGTLDYQSKQPRALLSGTVVSRRLNFSDLAPVIGADSNTSKIKRGAAPVKVANKVLPVEAFNTARWTSIDADIKFSAENILRKKELPINKLTTHLILQNGVMSMQPLNFGMAGGTMSANITLDGSGRSGKNAIKAEMKVSARHLKIQLLFPSVKELQASVGEIDGEASLSAIGNSVGSLLGASNGEIKSVIGEGTVSKLLLEKIGLNIGNIILTSLSGDKQVKLNCMATDFSVTNGLMQTRSFIIDTDAAVLDVSGNINLTQELLDLTIKPTSKGLRVLSLRAPIYVRGSFQHPIVSVDKGVMALRAGGAIALSLLAPVAAILPLMNTGKKENNQCAGLLAAARAKPVSPPPGKVYRNKIKSGVSMPR